MVRQRRRYASCRLLLNTHTHTRRVPQSVRETHWLRGGVRCCRHYRWFPGMPRHHTVDPRWTAECLQTPHVDLAVDHFLPLGGDSFLDLRGNHEMDMLYDCDEKYFMQDEHNNMSACTRT